MTKSNEEIDKIEKACRIAADAFSRVPEIAFENVNLDEVFRKFQVLCLELAPTGFLILPEEQILRDMMM